MAISSNKVHVVDTVYRYSRELEHSDPNLNLMEKLMGRDLLAWFTPQII